jgi:DNA-binding NtrC family response regulator
MDVLRQLARESEASVVMMSAQSDADAVVEAMRMGATDYLAKPFDADDLTRVVDRALAVSLPRGSFARVVAAPALGTIIGLSPAMLRTKELLARVAQSPASTVLITGESGTGKDLAAKAIHAASLRAAQPFVNVTCSSLPEQLLESELFGHEKGSFTDAKSRKLGLVEQADGGTLFLDEMGEMDVGLQSKLLRFLEEHAFRRVGGNADIQTDVRVIAATNVDLPRAVAERRFREDLYYRLAVLTVVIPPLRERTPDIPLLADYFVTRFSREFRKPISGITSVARRWMQTHPWPGNVRQLRNAIERAVLLARGDELDIGDFALVQPLDASSPDVGFLLPPAGIRLQDLERSLVQQALVRSRGNITAAGRLLGLNRDQVRYRIAKFSLREAPPEESTG